jgi:lipopolysaccharide export LptBFGC system permease protein LptF
VDLTLPAQPRDLLEVTGHPRHLSTPELARLIARRERAGFETAAHRVELYGRFAHPALGIALFLVLVPWAFRPQRRRSLSTHLGLATVLLGVVLAGGQALRLYALSERLPAFIGAWGGVLVCLVALPPSTWWARRAG